MPFQAPTKVLEITYHAGQVVNDFYLPNIIFWLARNKLKLMLEWHVLFIMDLKNIFFLTMYLCYFLSVD